MPRTGNRGGNKRGQPDTAYTAEDAEAPKRSRGRPRKGATTASRGGVEAGGTGRQNNVNKNNNNNNYNNRNVTNVVRSRGNNRGRGGYRGDRGGNVRGTRTSNRERRPPNWLGGPKDGYLNGSVKVYNRNDHAAINQAELAGEKFRLTSKYSKTDLEFMPCNQLVLTEDEESDGGEEADEVVVSDGAGAAANTGGPQNTNNNNQSEHPRSNVATIVNQIEASSTNNESSRATQHTVGRLQTLAVRENVEPPPESPGLIELDSNERYAQALKMSLELGKCVDFVEKEQAILAQKQERSDRCMVVLDEKVEYQNTMMREQGSGINKCIRTLQKMKDEQDKFMAQLNNKFSKSNKKQYIKIMSKLKHDNILVFYNIDKKEILEEAREFYRTYNGSFGIDPGLSFNENDVKQLRYVARWLVSIKMGIMEWEENKLYKYNSAEFRSYYTTEEGETVNNPIFAVTVVQGFRDEVLNAAADRELNVPIRASRSRQERMAFEQALRTQAQKNAQTPGVIHPIVENVPGMFTVPSDGGRPAARRRRREIRKRKNQNSNEQPPRSVPPTATSTITQKAAEEANHGVQQEPPSEAMDLDITKTVGSNGATRESREQVQQTVTKEPGYHMPPTKNQGHHTSLTKTQDHNTILPSHEVYVELQNTLHQRRSQESQNLADSILESQEVNPFPTQSQQLLTNQDQTARAQHPIYLASQDSLLGVDM